MWYGSNLGWGEGTDEIPHVIRYAQSRDGVHWEKQDRVHIDTSGSDNSAACRPCVVRDAEYTECGFALAVRNIGFTALHRRMV
ncbi:hypothetical protein RN06_1865 [Mycobacterium tuberculosis variant bovis BCG]|nr:hypothetical protein RN06_1865 [Mycobacterium tuberculosis variant bovis BCG]